MKSKKQSGSAYLIVIIVLIVALLGALSFIFWQNFINKSVSPAPVSTTTTSTSSELATLNIPELGIGVSYDNSLPAVGYTFQKENGGVAASVDITSKNLIGTSCVGDAGSIAQIVKNPTSTDNFTDSPIVATATVNSMKYVLTLSGSNCTSDKVLLIRYQASLEHNFLSLKAE